VSSRTFAGDSGLCMIEWISFGQKLEDGKLCRKSGPEVMVNHTVVRRSRIWGIYLSGGC